MKVGVWRPRGIFPSLPGGMDSVIKTYFDEFRSTPEGLPPELKGKVEGKLLPDQMLLNKWRVRTGGLRYMDKKTGAKLIGLLDDCLVVDVPPHPNPLPRGEGNRKEGLSCYYVPLDYKTRGWAPKEDTSSFYEHQVDIYEWLLKENGCKTNGTAYLVYYHPIEVRKDGIVQFEITPKRIATSPQRGRELFEAAVKILQKDAVPKSSVKCEFCPWGSKQSAYK